LKRPQARRKCFKELLVSVGYGEAAGIAVAKEQGLLFFSDDKKARQVAKEQGLGVSGTLGLGTLKLAVEAGMISIEEADKVLGEMIRGGYRSPIQSMKELFESEGKGRD
jgi:predicted nucleic acid-binding protein